MLRIKKSPSLHSEDYRSGHNEAVLKTVCLHGHGGSNPSSSANKKGQVKNLSFFVGGADVFEGKFACKFSFAHLRSKCKGAIYCDRPPSSSAKKYCRKGHIFCSIFLSIAKAMAYHHALACISSALPSISRQGEYIISRRLYPLSQ